MLLNSLLTLFDNANNNDYHLYYWLFARMTIKDERLMTELKELSWR
ncbi:MAG: hypothetical protein ACJA0T_002965 [Colwellia sp.]|jgi:hypothetical protein